MSLPDIDFRKIRAFGSPASRAGGFEQLACMLLEKGREWPPGTELPRFGDPDGGREGRATLPDGGVCAWQAKYLFTFDQAAASQVERSFERALATEPELVRYLVVFPIDLPAGDTDKRTSAHTLWSTKVERWKELAANSGRLVEFEFVGRHALTSMLLDQDRTAWIRYWFDESWMDDAWFQERISHAVAKAGHRYSPHLHTEVDAVRALEAVGRTEAYVARWREALAELRKSRRTPWRAPPRDSGEIAAALASITEHLDEIDREVTTSIASLTGFGDVPPPGDRLQVARQKLAAVRESLWNYPRQEDGRYERMVDSLLHGVGRIDRALFLLAELAGSAPFRAACRLEVLIAGPAGVGKTHLLCDIAKRRVKARLPTILLMGQDFDRRALRIQIPELAAFTGTAEEVVSTLAAASEAAGTVGLVMIDALNESERPDSWQDELRALQQIVARHPQAALAVSCRSEFLEDVVGESSMPTVTHDGFGESTEEAVARFTEEYGLETVSVPALHPEFSNPLFLKLACEALATLGDGRFPLGSAGLTTVCDAYLEAVNRRLSSRGKCDFDRESRLVQKAVQVLARECSDHSIIPREAADRLLHDLLPQEEWSKSLLKGLLDEGVLISALGGVTFGYQRIGDIARASLLCADTAEEIKDWVTALGHGRWAHRGTLEALAVMLPERHGIELIEFLMDDDEHARFDDFDLFINSLALRDANSVSGKTKNIARYCLEVEYLRERVCDQLLRLAWIPGHPLNSEWTHEWLMPRDIAERDAGWSQCLVGGTGQARPAGQLIAWARISRHVVKPEVRRLVGLMLGWMLTTTDNRVRDRATKALVALFDADPRTAKGILMSFAGVNDPYILERLAAAACGAALRATKPVVHHQLADGLTELFGAEWPTHVLTRDYAHRVFQLAKTTDWSPPDGADPDQHPYDGPPYRAAFPSATRTIAEIEDMAGPPDYDYSSIWFSLRDYGDFGKYVVSPAIRHFEPKEPEYKNLLELARRVIFDRVLDLGWRPDVFKEIDRRRGPSSGFDHTIERVGKKYQRIAFHELLGCLADHLPIDERWSDEPGGPYRHAEQLVYRDIDPTVLAQNLQAVDIDGTKVWFSPQQAAFDPIESGEYPSDINGIPDPLGLIAVDDPNGLQWLVLETHPNWKEILLPEEEALDSPWRSAWMQIRSYLVLDTCIPVLRDWVYGKDWFGRWMPEPREFYGALLATYPQDPMRESTPGGIEQHRAEREGLPCELQFTTGLYDGPGSSRDKSNAEPISGTLPSTRLYEVLGLSRTDDFSWASNEGLVVKDPSITDGGPSSLLASRRETVPRLRGHGISVLWTVLVGIDLVIPHSPHTDPARRWISASAAYALDGGDVVRLSATAQVEGPYEGNKTRLPWADSLRDRG